MENKHTTFPNSPKESAVKQSLYASRGCGGGAGGGARDGDRDRDGDDGPDDTHS